MSPLLLEELAFVGLTDYGSPQMALSDLHILNSRWQQRLMLVSQINATDKDVAITWQTI